MSRAERLRELLRHAVLCTRGLDCPTCLDAARVAGVDLDTVCAICRRAPRTTSRIVCATCGAQEIRHG